MRDWTANIGATLSGVAALIEFVSSDFEPSTWTGRKAARIGSQPQATTTPISTAPLSNGSSRLRPLESLDV